MWAITIVQYPRSTPWLKNSVNSEAPITISGVVSGSTSSTLIAAAAVHPVAGRARGR